MMDLLLARRRMMTMPQQGDPYVNWLKSIGCVVYLPLSASGDLTDRISGLSLQISGQGSFTWDGNEGMYKVTTPSTQFRYVASLENGMTASDFPSNSFTAMTTFKKVTNNGYPALTQMAPKSTDDNTLVSMNPLYNASAVIANYPATAVKLARSESSTERKYYQEGTLYYTNPTPATQLLPSNWVLTAGGGLIIGFVRQADSFYYNKEYYIKDIYLFNGELTLSQIRHIQGYE